MSFIRILQTKYNLSKTYYSPIIDLIKNTDLNTGGNGGGKFRLDTYERQGIKVGTMNKRGECRFTNCFNETEREEAQTQLRIYANGQYDSTNRVWLIYFRGKIDIEKQTRTIRKDIREFYKNKPCVNCGTTCNVEVDHKNGLYNEPRVLNVKLQVKEDFQVLCKHCNGVKREAIKEAKKSGRRPSALDIPKFVPFNIAYLVGNETFDISDKDAMIGTYWYDPIAFLSQLPVLHKQNHL